MSQPLQDAVAEEIRVALARRRMTQADLARALGKSPPWVSMRLSGQITFDVSDLELIAAGLKVPVTSLLASAA
jgi:transcriptional regulator with XRE-family HTH domain